MTDATVKPGGYREMLRVAYPLLLSMGTFTIMQFCDRVFLARFSEISIQAALPAGILSFTLICFFHALAGYAGTFVAQYHGAGQPEGCVRATAQGIWLSLLSWPVILALIPVGFWLMRVSGHAPAVLREEYRFFWILMAAGVVVPLSTAIGGFFTGQGRMLANTLSNIAACLLNILLDYALIFGHWGSPALGITGAAIATSVAGCVPPAVQFILFLRDLAMVICRVLRINIGNVTDFEGWVLLPSAALVYILAPKIIQMALNTRPLGDSPLRRRLEDLCRRMNLKYRDILLWQTQYSMGNAAVIGILPRMRYVLLSDLLIETMSDEQIEAVFAHELGHIVHKHMVWYVVFFAILTLASMGLTGGLNAVIPHVPGLRSMSHDALQLLVSGISVLVSVVVLFGFVSRRFERQADVFAARMMQSGWAHGPWRCRFPSAQRLTSRASST